MILRMLAFHFVILCVSSKPAWMNSRYIDASPVTSFNKCKIEFSGAMATIHLETVDDYSCVYGHFISCFIWFLPLFFGYRSMCSSYRKNKKDPSRSDLWQASRGISWACAVCLNCESFVMSKVTLQGQHRQVRDICPPSLTSNTIHKATHHLSCY